MLSDSPKFCFSYKEKLEIDRFQEGTSSLNCYEIRNEKC